MAVADASSEGGLYGQLLPAQASGDAGSKKRSRSDGGDPSVMLWTVALDAAMVGIGITVAMLGPTLIGITKQLGISSAVAGTLFTAKAAGYMSASLIGGELFDRLNNMSMVFLIPCFCTCIGSFAMPFVASYPLACVLFFFQGVTMSMLDTGGNVLILTLWRDSDQLNRQVHALHFFYGFGCVIAPAVVALCVHMGLTAVTAWIVAGICMVPSTALFISLAFLAQPSATQEQGDGGVNMILLLIGSFLGVYVGAEITFGGYIDDFAVTWLEAPEPAAAWLTSVYWGMLTFGRLVAAVVTPYVHHERYLAGHVLLALGAVGVMALLSDGLRGVAMPGSTDWWAFVVAPSAVEGFALAPLFPGAMLVAEELGGKPISGRAASFIVACAGFGEMIFPLLTGIVMSWHATYFLWCQVLLCSVATVIFFFASRRLLVLSGSKS
eukprot:TRINITY_DN68592_c0_g1_i1.p1 TRINITY_DN68592_c0_g1~~TRINITY_DN68592_c0_g1_i1.p1  ORF type:complete len:450 (+),score=63.00 TRINITY_DN68592_c0_g1_i1:39-1352(+)